ncbi:MAG: hypothetical protein GY943_37225 [Chloroflexi bacterium]|nr:hypothetical protein [Chloroflexota bacterium]
MWGFVQLIGINPPYIEIRFLTQFAALFGLAATLGSKLFSLFCLNFFAGMFSAIASGLFFVWRRRRGDAARIGRRLGWLQLGIVGLVVWTAVTIPVSITDELVIALFLGGMAAFGLALTFGGLNYGQSFRTEIRVRGVLKWSWRSAVLFGAVGALLSLVWSGIIWLSDPTAVTVNPASGLHTGIMLGILAGTVHGFNDVIKHIIVRLLLWRKQDVSLNYVRLLNYATDCVLLQKVGGGYAFRHRLLQDHFAD